MNPLDPFGFVLLRCEILHVLASNLIRDFAVLTKDIKILVAKVSQQNVGVGFLAILELIHRLARLENILGAEKQDVLFLEFIVIDSLAQSIQIKHPLVIPGALGQFTGVDHLQLDIERAAVSGITLPCLHIQAHTLVEGILLEGGLGNHTDLFDVNLQDVLQEILRDIRIAKNLCEHEVVTNCQFLVFLHMLFFGTCSCGCQAVISPRSCRVPQELFSFPFCDIGPREPTSLRFPHANLQRRRKDFFLR
ncbi:hypothetical protein MMG03_003144 [Fibrobacter succinogenes]|nr:hypothetical protein [Fibrobacter succinogenes]